MKQSQLWTKNFIMMILANLSTFLAFQMLSTTLALFITVDLGGDNSQVGAAVGLLTVAALLIRPITGNAVMKYKKTTILMIGLVIISISKVSYFFVTTIPVLFFVRLLHGIGFGICTTTTGTIAADIIPPSRRGEGIGYYGLASTISLAIGPIAAVFIAETFGFSVLFICGLLLTLFAIFLVTSMDLPSILPPRKMEKQSFLNSVFEKKALMPSLLLFLLAITLSGISSFLILFGVEQGIGNVTLVFLVKSVFVLLTRPITGKIYDKFGHFPIIVPCGIFMFLGTLLISFSHSLPLFLLAGAIFGVGFGPMIPALQAWMIELIEPHRRGVGSATFFSAMDIGIGLGAIICGVILNATSYAIMFRYSSLFILVMLIVYFVHVYREKMQVQEEDRKKIAA